MWGVDSQFKVAIFLRMMEIAFLWSPMMASCRNIITGTWSLSPLLDAKNVHLVCRTDLFKISNLGYRPMGRPKRRWVDNIRMDLQEVGCGYMDWIGLAQDWDRWRTLVIAVMNLRVPWNAGNFLTSSKPVSCSRRTLHHGVSKQVYGGSEIEQVCIAAYRDREFMAGIVS